MARPSDSLTTEIWQSSGPVSDVSLPCTRCQDAKITENWKEAISSSITVTSSSSGGKERTIREASSNNLWFPNCQIIRCVCTVPFAISSLRLSSPTTSSSTASYLSTADPSAMKESLGSLAIKISTKFAKSWRSIESQRKCANLSVRGTYNLFYYINIHISITGGS